MVSIGLCFLDNKERGGPLTNYEIRYIHSNLLLVCPTYRNLRQNSPYILLLQMYIASELHHAYVI